MHGREEWVLVQLGSQHKRVERPVQLEFPDYPFLVTMVIGNIAEEEICLSFRKNCFVAKLEKICQETVMQLNRYV